MLTDEEFAEFVQSRGPALLRTACFLGGSRHDGEDLLQQTLVSVYASYKRIREPAALEAYVRTRDGARIDLRRAQGLAPARVVHRHTPRRVRHRFFRRSVNT